MTKASKIQETSIVNWPDLKEFGLIQREVSFVESWWTKQHKNKATCNFHQAKMIQ